MRALPLFVVWLGFHSDTDKHEYQAVFTTRVTISFELHGFDVLCETT
jgi:hypothetical protein